MDRRFDRTERAIAKAFTGLLCTTSYASITTSEIIEHAGIGRSTFYAHYHGKDDVLRAVVQSICDHVLSPVGPESGHDFSGHHTSEALIEHTLLHLRERESGIRALVFSDSAGVLARCLREQLVGYHRRPPLFGSREGCLASSHSPEEGARMPANPFAILSNALATSLDLTPTCRYARARARAIAAPATAMAAANSSTSPVCAATEATSAPVASVAA